MLSRILTLTCSLPFFFFFILHFSRFTWNNHVEVKLIILFFLECLVIINIVYEWNEYTYTHWRIVFRDDIYFRFADGTLYRKLTTFTARAKLSAQRFNKADGMVCMCMWGYLEECVVPCYPFLQHFIPYHRRIYHPICPSSIHRLFSLSNPLSLSHTHSPSLSHSLSFSPVFSPVGGSKFSTFCFFCPLKRISWTQFWHMS